MATRGDVLLTPAPPRKRTGDPQGKCRICQCRPQAAEWLKVSQVAHVLGVNPRTVRRLLADGSLRGIRLKRSLRVDHDSLDDYVLSRDTLKNGTD